MFAHINETNLEIKKNSIAYSKILKKNQIYKNWEEYFACLTGGYIYFYVNSTDEDYYAYYYIKDCEIIFNNEEKLMITLKNIYGMIELKFQNEEKMKKWISHLNERIHEMKYSFDVKAKELNIINKNKKFIYNEMIYFGMELNINKVKIQLYQEEKINTGYFENENLLIQSKSFNKVFDLTIKDFKILMNMKEYDIITNLSMNDFMLQDCNELEKNKKPKLMIKNVRDRNFSSLDQFKNFNTEESYDSFYKINKTGN